MQASLPELRLNWRLSKNMKNVHFLIFRLIANVDGLCRYGFVNPFWVL